ncbi:MAG: hypothetical protein ACYCWN_07805 [Ferrimicrobium sp.]|uniref:Uncharacterized protein n=1 Tax=Ferrimicrobium acidiphilum TaxID=121039 RepID=A0ABV3Y2K4_9ACTN|nr:hypothetical protein [Ferrimicrobium sp.]
MRIRQRLVVLLVFAPSGLLGACGSTEVPAKASHSVDTSAESPTQLAKLPHSFPVAVVPLPKGAPLVDVVNDSTTHHAQFQLTYAPRPALRASFMGNYVRTLRGLGFVLKQHSYADTPAALYSLEDAHWEVLVEGSSSTVGVSVVAFK